MRLCFLIIIFIGALNNCLAQQPVTRSELEKRRQHILEAIKLTQEQLEATKNDKKVTLSELRALQNKLSERQKLINNINEEINAINHNIQYSAKEIDALRKELETLKVRYAQSIRYAYKNRDSYNMLAFLFASQNFNEAVRRLKYLKRYRDYRKQQAEDIRQTQARIEQKLGILNSEKTQKDILLATETKQKQVIQKETQEKDQIIQALKGREKELMSDIDKNQKSLRQLEKTISNLIQREIELAKKREEEQRRQAEERRKLEEAQMAASARTAPSSATSPPVQVVTGSGVENAVSNEPKSTTTPKPATEKPIAKATPEVPTKVPEPAKPSVAKPNYNLSLTPEVSALSSNFEANKGMLPWPVEKGYIAEGFGRKKHPVYKIEIENSGIEILTSAQATARAVFNGTVTNVFFVPGMGQCVLVTHGNYFTVYSRLGNVSVKKGDKITMKQPIGNVVANEEGEYLMHFELWKVGSNDKSFPLDPATWIAR